MIYKKLVKIRNVSKVFDRGTPLELKVLDGISMDITAGEILLIMGPSGSGKTTLLTIIGGLLKPTSGEVIFKGRPLNFRKLRTITNYRRNSIGFIFQTNNLLHNLTALENVMAGHFGIKGSKEKAISLLRELDIYNRRKSLPRDLSGGEKQRITIARALINDPQIILADEPTANIDKAHKEDILQLLQGIAKDRGKAVVLVSHDERVARFADRIINLVDGKIVDN